MTYTIKCDHCKTRKSGGVDVFIEAGWNRAIIASPNRRTLTACPEHTPQFEESLKKLVTFPEKLRQGWTKGKKIGIQPRRDKKCQQ